MDVNANKADFLRVMPAAQVLQQRQDQADTAANAAVQPDQNVHLIDALSSYVERVWQTNRNAKMVMQQTMINCLLQRNGVYTTEKLAAIKEQGGSEIYMNLTNVKCRAAESWVMDTMFPDSGEHPFKINPTAIPEIPPEVKAQIAQIAQGELQLAIQNGLYPSPEKMRLRAEDMENQLRQRVKEEARRRCDLMEDEIDEMLQEGDWYDAIPECVSDFITLPGTVLKGPATRKQKTLGWARDATGLSKPMVQDKLIPHYYRVSPLDLYPSPDSSGAHDGDLLEHMRFRRSSLYEMIGVPGYSEERIRAALEEYKDGNTLIEVQEQQQREALGQAYWWSAVEKPIDALEFHGNIQGAMLIQWGMDPKQVPDPLVEYPIIALKVGRFVVRCIINDDPLGRRPYEVESFEKVNGAFWGKGVPQIMSDLQDVCNATARALVNNMAIASGPLTEIEADRLADGETVDSLYPWRMIFTKSAKTTSPSPAVRWNQPDIISNELLQVYTYFSRLADDYTGIPAYAYGSAAVGGAATTSSGLSQLMSNAARGIKRAIARFDKLINGSVKRAHTHIMMYDPDTSLHGDIEIVSRGVASLIGREQQQQRKTEFLQATANPFDMAIIGVQGRARILRDIVAQFGIPVDEVIPSADELRQRQMPPQQPGAPGAPGQPPQPGGQMPSPAGGPGQPGMGPPPSSPMQMDAGGNPAGGLNLFQGAN